MTFALIIYVVNMFSQTSYQDSDPTPLVSHLSGAGQFQLHVFTTYANAQIFDMYCIRFFLRYVCCLPIHE